MDCRIRPSRDYLCCPKFHSRKPGHSNLSFVKKGATSATISIRNNKQLKLSDDEVETQ